MEETAIDSNVFLQYLTYYLKMQIYFNKGTSNNKAFDACVTMHNMYKRIENKKQECLIEADETTVRRCYKRFNLVLKIDENGYPIDITNKNHQLNMVNLLGHPSLYDGNLESMISYCESNKINIFRGVHLNFFIQEGEQQLLVWHYTRLLFFVSQLLISQVEPDEDPDDPDTVKRMELFDASFELFEEILEIISSIDKKLNYADSMTKDKLLKKMLVEDIVLSNNTSQASEEVKKLLNSNGIDADNPLISMVDKISSKLDLKKITKGNILNNFREIAQSVVKDVGEDVCSDPQNMMNMFTALKSVSNNVINNSGEDAVPENLKNMLRMFNGLDSSNISSETPANILSTFGQVLDVDEHGNVNESGEAGAGANAAANLSEEDLLNRIALSINNGPTDSNNSSIMGSIMSQIVGQ